MKIIFTRGLLAGNVVDLEGDIIRIGRGEENELCLMTGGVSRYHGRLEHCPDGSWKLIDLNSTNGIKVNGVKIDGEAMVTPDDDIEIGEQTMRFEPGAGDMMTSAPGQVSINTALEAAAVPAEPPPAAAVPVRPESPAAEENAVSMTELKDLLGGKGESLFAGSKGDAAVSSGTEQKKKGSRRSSNLLFYTVLGALVVMGLSYCARKFSVPEKKAAAEVTAEQSAAQPFFLNYERTVIRKDNVFRFAVLVENNFAVVTVDDLKHRRAIRREIKEPMGINLLRSKIKSSGLLQLKPVRQSGSDMNGDAAAVRRRMVFQEGFNVCEHEFTGEFVPMEMERVDAAVSDFAEIHGMHTVSLTPEELMAQAEASLQKADDLFNNREAGLVNLREAIIRYANAVSCLEQFSPRPRRWDYARKRLEEAGKIRKDKYKELLFEYNRLLKLREFDRLRSVLKQIMEITDPDSVQYEQARERLFKIDSHTAGKGRK